MIEINAGMEAIVRRSILSFIATINEDGSPNPSPKTSLTVVNGTLYFADIASPRTILNLRRNPTVEIDVVDIFQRRGSVDHVVKIDTTSITPRRRRAHVSADPPSAQDEIRDTKCEKWGVKLSARNGTDDRYAADPSTLHRGDFLGFTIGSAVAWTEDARRAGRSGL